MNSENLITSEGDDDDDKIEDSTTTGGGTAKRSYECTFCKRGFTNAQALGGHMNIHRKDRAKAKQVIINMPNKFTNNNDHQYSSSIAFQPLRHYYSTTTYESSQRNFDMCFLQLPSAAPPPSNPIIRNYQQPSAAPVSSFPYDQFHNPFRSSNIHLNNQDQLSGHGGPNLSLQIGPSTAHHHVDINNSNNHHIRRGTQKENEVDLELRLGHHP